jgi:hypothetical protein
MDRSASGSQGRTSLLLLIAYIVVLAFLLYRLLSEYIAYIGEW